TTLEERGRAAENEVDVTGDERILEILTAAVEEDRVLPSKEAAVAKDDSIAVDAQRQRLADWAGAVLEGQVLCREVVGVDDGRRRTERADRFAVDARHVRVEVVGEHRARGILADQRDEALLALHVDQLAIGAGLDEDDPAIRWRRILRHRIDR